MNAGAADTAACPSANARDGAGGASASASSAGAAALKHNSELRKY